MIRISSNADAVIARLKRYRDGLGNKMRVFLERIAEIGVNTADVKFRTAQYDGVNDVTVSEPYWESENRLVIEAGGSAVSFIEFGSGVRYTEHHPKATALGMIRGEYGKGRGKRDTWGYYGDPGTNGVVRKTVNDKGDLVLTHGNPPARAMYDAGKEMRLRMAEIAREVFRGD